MGQFHGGAYADLVTSITIDAIGNVYINGGFEGTADFDPGSDTLNLTSVGLYDFFVLKMSEYTPTSIAVSENSKNRILIYPNPTTGILTIEGAEGIASVYDIYGRLVLTANTNALDISQAATGIYFVRIVDEQGKVYVAKVMKE